MNLTLEIISDQRASLGENGVMSFTVHGGSIGRSVSNDWVLPDPERFVSGRHAAIQFQKGSYYIIDTSTNGVFINDSQTPLGRGKYRRLRGGEKIRIGAYEMTATVTRDEDQRDRSPENLSLEDKDELISITAVLEEQANQGGDTETDLGEELRDTPGGQVGVETDENGGDWNMIHMPLTGERPVLDTVDPDPSMELMPGFDLQPKRLTELELELEKEEQEEEKAKAAKSKRVIRTRETKPKKEPARTKVAGPEPVERARSDLTKSGTYREPGNGLAQLLHAAGLDPSGIPPSQSERVLQIAGQLIREFIVGVMEVLQTRAQLKNRLKVSQTMIQSAEYNPLKFSANVDDAMRGLLLRGKDHYLPGVESVRQSFIDLKHHEMAMLVATKSAVEELLDRFDPEHLKERFDAGLKRGPLMGATNKMKYWDLYEDFFQFVAQNAEGEIPQIFAEAFAKAYEAEVRRLKSQRKPPRKSTG